MGKLSIIFWRDIPAQVNIQVGKKYQKQQLSDRFQKAIDKAAMQSNTFDSDSYLAQWRRGPNIECSDNLKFELKKFINNLESEYTEKKLIALSKSGGFYKNIKAQAKINNDQI